MEWSWIRQPIGRATDELQDLVNKISLYEFDFRKKDRWRWIHSTDSNLTVRKLSAIVEEKLLPGCDSGQQTLRNNLVPKKGEIFVWRTLKKRLPVLKELDKRGVDLKVYGVQCAIMMLNPLNIL
ncbi:uncharacterized protein [Rutidosis leptorrhynchoides]|uniref:uncharacterized protein n=1 Tax=Rutidosis leptorrhynchoides TaxID=125765 RepID=UPI003A99CA9A